MLLAVAVVSLLLAAALLVSEPAPYVVTAIDYHFHDAHPTFPIEETRSGRQEPGSQPAQRDDPGTGVLEGCPSGCVAHDRADRDRLAPGRYELFCRLHRDRGMTGVIVIAAE